jgi:hypothetical protein
MDTTKSTSSILLSQSPRLNAVLQGLPESIKVAVAPIALKYYSMGNKGNLPKKVLSELTKDHNTLRKIYGDLTVEHKGIENCISNLEASLHDRLEAYAGVKSISSLEVALEYQLALSKGWTKEITPNVLKGNAKTGFSLFIKDGYTEIAQVELIPANYFQGDDRFKKDIRPTEVIFIKLSDWKSLAVLSPYGHDLQHILEVNTPIEFKFKSLIGNYRQDGLNIVRVDIYDDAKWLDLDTVGNLKKNKLLGSQPSVWIINTKPYKGRRGDRGSRGPRGNSGKAGDSALVYRGEDKELMLEAITHAKKLLNGGNKLGGLDSITKGMGFRKSIVDWYVLSKHESKEKQLESLGSFVLDWGNALK